MKHYFSLSLSTEFFQVQNMTKKCKNENYG
jgi:hypothetical protein